MVKRAIFSLVILVTSWAIAGQAQQSPAPAAPASAPPAAAEPAGRAGGGNPAAVSNERAGVAIDRFVGNPTNSPAHLSHGGLVTHSILRAGDPYAPGAPGAVLEYRKDVVKATLVPGNRTALVPLPDQYLYYVTEGEGRLDDGNQFWDLREGMAVLIPPDLPRRFVNESTSPLVMVMVNWTPSETPRADILVRDTRLLPYCEENAHWNNMSKCIFRAADGLYRSERFYLVLLQPWAMSEPHTHSAGTEEVWTKLSPGTAVMLLGSELRDMPQYSAYLVPPTGITQHANLNLSKVHQEAWLYMAHGPITPAPPAGGAGRGGRGGGRGSANPNLFTDQAAAEQATIVGRPLR